jgi:hypothetical protein
MLREMLVEFLADLVSCFDSGFDMGFLGNEVFLCFGVHKLRLIKNLTPLQASPVRNTVWAF